MKKLNRFVALGIENADPDATELSYSKRVTENATPEGGDDMALLQDEANEINNKMDINADSAEVVAETLENLKDLEYTVESILASGKISKEISMMVDQQLRIILRPYGEDSNKASLENFSSPTDHLVANLENIQTTFKKYSAAQVKISTEGSWHMFDFFRTNSKIAVNYRNEFDEFKHKFSSLSTDTKVNIPLIFVRFFNVKYKFSLPDIERDLKLSKYICHDYNSIVIESIKKLTSIVAAGDYSSPETAQHTVDAITQLTHPSNLFDVSHFNQLYFGPFRFQEAEDTKLQKLGKMLFKGSNADYHQMLQPLIKAKPIREFLDGVDTSYAPSIGISTSGNLAYGVSIRQHGVSVNNTVTATPKEILELIAYGDELTKVLLDAENKLKVKSEAITNMWAVFKAAEDRSTRGTHDILNSIASVAGSFQDCYTYPLKDEVNRIMKILKHVNVVIKQTAAKY